MNKKVLFYSLLAFIILFSITSSIFSKTSETQKIYVGNHEIYFNRVFQNDTDKDGILDKASYFQDNNLVLTIWDYDQDGLPEAWFVYDEEEYLMLQAEDFNKDGQPDEFSYFNREEQVIKKETTEKTMPEQPVENPFSKEKSIPESPTSEEETYNNLFVSDHGQLTLTINDINLQARETGELAWILELSMQAKTDLELYSTEYWFIYPDCPQEDVYACGDSTGITYDYINNPSRNYEKAFPEYQGKYYTAGQTVSRRFTLPLCMEAYQQYGTARVNLVQAVEYYLDSEERVETLEWKYYSP